MMGKGFVKSILIRPTPNVQKVLDRSKGFGTKSGEKAIEVLGSDKVSAW